MGKSIKPDKNNAKKHNSSQDDDDLIDNNTDFAERNSEDSYDASIPDIDQPFELPPDIERELEESDE